MATVIELCIVGIGPRGLVALERLIGAAANLEKCSSLNITLFESSAYPGCGPNYAPDQPRCNQLNIPFREIPLTSRSSVDGHISYTEFSSYQQWHSQQQHDVDDSEKDFFPARADIGSYLQARFQSILDANPSTVTLICEEVVAAERRGEQWQLLTDSSAQLFKFDEVLLAIGHQPTWSEKNVKDWIEIASKSDTCFFYPQPYPNQPLIDSDVINSTSVVALRGMGLSMIDVVKSLTLGRGGEFTINDPAKITMQYKPSGREPNCIVPFSLDGQPMAPKPVNAGIDNRFDIPEATIRALESSLNADDSTFVGNKLRDTLIHWVSTAASSVFFNQEAYFPATARELQADSQVVASLAKNWLQDEHFSHALITDTTAPTEHTMQLFLDMATGNQIPSLDFCVGQVWRKLQPTFYECLRFRHFDSEVIEAAIALGQRMKRYAFGPPADAIAMLIALHKTKLLLFKIADDPDITSTDKGWTLFENSDAIVANILINTVLDQAQLSKMSSDLVLQLNNDGYIQAVHESLGAKAKKDGSLITASTQSEGPNATGRLIMGSVFEADALLCCFGDDMTNWASSVLSRQRHKIQGAG